MRRYIRLHAGEVQVSVTRPDGTRFDITITSDNLGAGLDWQDLPFLQAGPMDQGR